MSKVYFDPIHKSEFYEQKLNTKAFLPVTEKISSQILSLPIYPGMPKDDIKLVSENIKKFFE